jgi:hypothetical protein
VHLVHQRSDPAFEAVRALRKRVVYKDTLFQSGVSLPHQDRFALPAGVQAPELAINLIRVVNTASAADADLVMRALRAFLGNTLIAPDLASARAYRELLIAHRVSCPTIYTRSEKERLGSDGVEDSAQHVRPCFMST